MATKRIVIAFSFFIFCNLLNAQNLVVNGNFDTLASCPNNQGQLNRATPWQSAKGTCDLYNTCNSGNYSVPTNISGTQTARSGSGYAGFFANQGMWVNEIREYLHAQLRSPLIAGHTYCVSFYVNLSDLQNSFGDYDSDLAVNDIGAYFSQTGFTPNPNNFAHIPVAPQVVNPSTNPLIDRVNWQQISGSFVATGGENFITIGSFASNANQDTTELDIWQSNKTSYYFVDDVSVLDCSVSSPFSTSISGANSICQGSQLSLTANVVGGNSPFQYNWNNTGFSTSASFETTAISDSVYTLEVKDASNAVTSSTYFVDVIPLPNGQVTSDTVICKNSMLSLNASGGTSYQWYDGPSGTVQTTTSNIVIQVSGDLDLVVGIYNGTCVDFDTVAITTIIPPSISVSIDTSICYGESVALEVNGIGNYLWETGSTNGTITVQPTATTNYWVSVSNASCVSKDSITVSVIPLPIINCGNDKTICLGQLATLTASGNSSVSWNTGATNNSITVSPLTNTTYYATTTNGQCQNSDSVKVNVIQPPIANAGNDLNVCQGSIVSLVGQGGGTYSWNIGSTNDTATFVAQFSSSIVLTVSNGVCSDKDTLQLSVIPKDESPCKEIISSVEVPNIFTPNGDGSNDVFEIKTIDIKNYKLDIYNRWGNLIYSVTESQPYWDGTTSNSEKSIDGTYYYILNAFGYDTKTHVLKGFFQLLR